MNTRITIIASILFGVAVLASSFAECETSAFIEAVNSAWVATNYPLIKQAITNRLAECTNDLLAKGLYFEYFFSIETDFALA